MVRANAIPALRSIAAPLTRSSLRPLPLPLLARPLSTSAPRLFATPTTGPQRVSPGPIRSPPAKDVLGLTGKDNRHKGDTEPDSEAVVAEEAYPDYSKGPSAIDKAAQLFFFTEIVRGESCAPP